MHLAGDEIYRLITRLWLIYSCCRLAARANARTGSGGGEIHLAAAVVEEEDKVEEVRGGRAERETFQRERAGLGTTGNSVLLLPAAAATQQMAAAIEDTPQNGSREELVVATVEPSGGAQQASKAASNGHQAPSPPNLQPGGTQRKNLDRFNFTDRQPAPVMTKIGSRDPMVKKMVYNQYRDMLRKYSNASTSP